MPALPSLHDEVVPFETLRGFCYLDANIRWLLAEAASPTFQGARPATTPRSGPRQAWSGLQNSEESKGGH